MNANVITVNEVTFEQVFLLAQRLRPVDQARLAVRLAPKVEWLLNFLCTPPGDRSLAQLIFRNSLSNCIYTQIKLKTEVTSKVSCAKS